MTDGKIYITISDKRKTDNGGVDGGSVGGEPVKVEKENNKSNALVDYAKHEFFHLIRQTASTFVNYSISNIGNFTGNYLGQQNLSISISNLGKLYNLGMSTVAGAKIGGGVGAVVGLAVGVTSEVVQFGLSEKTAYFNNSRTNREISMMRELSGLNTLTNESR